MIRLKIIGTRKHLPLLCSDLADLLMFLKGELKSRLGEDTILKGPTTKTTKQNAGKENAKGEAHVKCQGSRTDTEFFLGSKKEASVD